MLCNGYQRTRPGCERDFMILKSQKQRYEYSEKGAMPVC